MIGALPEDAIVGDWRELCLFLGGDDTSFTGKLLELTAKADITNRPKLRMAFPREVVAWELWAHADAPMTAAQLNAEIRRLLP